MATMIVVGLAGGSGTGKSTIAAHLVDAYGAVHVDGDRVAHEVLEEDAVRRALKDEFGAEVFDSKGRVDRRRLGGIVFASDSRLRALNAIVHPAVVGRCAAEVSRARMSGAPMAVIDAALLLEVPMTFPIDLTIALQCDRDERVRRLLAKGGRSEAEIHDRLARQDGMEKHFYKADAVVDTGRDLAAVLADVDALVDAAIQRAT